MVMRFNTNAKQKADEIIEFGMSYTGRQLTEFINGLTLEVDGELKKVTPFKTGNARNSWHFDLYNEGTRQAENFNTAPYIRKLEHGHSMQAPQGMTIIVFGKLDGIVRRMAAITGMRG